MSRIKHTKNELKAQRDALRRFERYLPTLQLKKQQLQMEVRRLEGQIEQKKGEEEKLRLAVNAWIRLFAEPFPFGQYLRLAEVRSAEGNIAGIAIPVLEEMRFERKVPDLFLTPPWVDSGLEALEQLLRLRVERRILDEQHRLLAEELRITSQRVNLFEKVKIPECGENIRVIRIFLGDEQTADVVRGKIAKGRSVRAA
jgi:V/A-type H+-transporting ATPase subunit D